MSVTQPIRNCQNLERFKGFYETQSPSPRNHALVILGLNTALRISDLLRLKWEDVYDIKTHSFKTHLSVTEQKTNKKSKIALNQTVLLTLEQYYREADFHQSAEYLFPSNKGSNSPISRCQAYRIIRKAAEGAGLEHNISCHSLRKTFGYHAWKNGVHPVLIMNIYNHSSFQITKRYLGIEQDDRDQVFLNMNL